MTVSILQTDIPRRCNRCQNCNVLFSGGDCYFSILSEEGRQDFCLSCWQAKEFPASTCYWKATIPARKSHASKAPTKQELLIALLKRTLEEDPCEALLIALYLARKRIVVFRKDYTESGQTYSLYEAPSTEEMIAIKKTSLLNINLESIQASVTHKLATIANSEEHTY